MNTNEILYTAAMANLPRRLAAKIAGPDSNGCWLWTACAVVSNNGNRYGLVRWDGRRARAHRVVFHGLFGEAVPA